MKDKLRKKQMDGLCGPGGRFCYCCNIYRGAERKLLYRRLRRKHRQEIKKCLKDE